MSFEVFIEPGRAERNYWKDLWRYRELFYILSWRDIKIRYKQTIIGVIWSVLRPLLTIMIFTFVFGQIAKFEPPPGINYAVLVFAGLLPWQFFATGFSEASNSLLGNERLISKVYFPRLIIPASAVITSLVDFLISLVLMFGLLVWFRVVPSINLVFLPIFIVLAFIASFGVGLWLTAVNVKFRDFKHVVPFLVQVGLYVSPVAFVSEKAASIIPEKFRLLYYLNPMAGVIDGFRWCFFGDKTPLNWSGMFISLGVIAFFLFIGFRTFRKMERTFADLI
ncbi:MAG TPA: ABC transporter permease [Chitinophagaceae bacterium]|jgi:lipopolysaccharide transport system permease protein|nr:ABC transporter permease [Chitinophagaceae bacterium]